MGRTTTTISGNVKVKLVDIKKKFNLKSESEVIAYLMAIHDLTYEKITHKQHLECMEVAKEIGSQEVLKL